MMRRADNGNDHDGEPLWKESALASEASPGPFVQGARLRSKAVFTAASHQKSKKARSSMGDRVEIAAMKGFDNSFRPMIQDDGDEGDEDDEKVPTRLVSQSRRLWSVLLSLLAWLIVINAIAYTLVEFVILERNPDWNTEKMFASFENPYWDKIVDTVPFVQRWYRDLDIDEGRNPLLKPEEAIEHMCYEAFLSSRFDLEKTEEYHKFFREDSVFSLAQTGDYHGPDEIAEYVNFALVSSPYIAETELIENELIFKQFDDQDNTCEFLILRKRWYKMEENFTRYGADFYITVLARGFFKVGGGKENNYMKQMSVYLPVEWLRFLFGVLLDSDKTRKYVCSVMAGPCNNPVDQCEERLAALDVAQGDQSWLDGNSQGCRAIHSVFAEKNTNHCAHISLTPMLDPKGRIKCQDSKGVMPTDIFEDEDIQIFEEFQTANDINPVLGFDAKCDEGGWCQETEFLAENDEPLFPPNGPPFSGTKKDSIPPAEPKSACLKGLFGILNRTVAFTSPSHVELVLQNMGLAHKPLVRIALQAIITAPQPLVDMYSESSTCLLSNQAVVEMTCIMAENYQWNETISEEEEHILEYLVNQATVYEKITLASLEDVALLYEIMNVMSHERRESIEDAIRGNYAGDERDDLVLAYRSAVLALTAFTKSIAEEITIPNKIFLQMSILEGVKRDIKNDLNENARVGMAVAAPVQFDSIIDDSAQKWRLGKTWVDAYVAWSMANAWGALPADLMLALLIPSTSCTTEHGEDFMARRTVSLSLAVMHRFDLPLSKEAIIERQELEDIGKFFIEQADRSDLPQSRRTVSLALGAINRRYVGIESPSNDIVEKMLYQLCGERCHNGSWKGTDTDPQSLFLDEEQFYVYIGFILFITCLLAGLGSEFLFFVFYLQRDGWTKENETKWKLAQFIFPLLLATTLGLAISRNYLALPILVGGLWKFGYPETIMYQYMAFYNEDHNRIQKLGDFLNATGTISHHAAAAMAISMMLTGVIVPDRHAVSPCFILVMQHWLILAKYVSKNLYFAVQLILEVFFEWSIISNFEYNVSNHWTASLTSAVMLFAHWEYLLAAFLELFVFDAKTDDDWQHRHSDYLSSTRESMQRLSQMLPLRQSALDDLALMTVIMKEEEEKENEKDNRDKNQDGGTDGGNDGVIEA